MNIVVNRTPGVAVAINQIPSKTIVSVTSPGSKGEPGSQIYSGFGTPSDIIGIHDDYYIDKTNKLLYGPKTTTWGQPIPLGSTFITEEIIVTQPILDAKYITLQSTPSIPNAVELMIFGGIEQKHGVDYVINGNILSWNSLALELLLDLQTTFIVRYTI